jgi:hypothetical protein
MELTPINTLGEAQHPITRVVVIGQFAGDRFDGDALQAFASSTRRAA